MRIPEPGLPPIRHRIHAKHYWLHAASGLLVFALGVGADLAVMELRHRWPHKVRWQSNTVAIHRLPGMIGANFWQTNVPGAIEFGFADDGTVFWRMK